MDTKAPQQITDWLAKQERTASWLARKCDVTPAAVTRWLTTAGASPSYENRQRLAQITGLDIAKEEDWK